MEKPPMRMSWMGRMRRWYPATGPYTLKAVSLLARLRFWQNGFDDRRVPRHVLRVLVEGDVVANRFVEIRMVSQLFDRCLNEPP
jgi:hypothetical protein